MLINSPRATLPVATESDAAFAIKLMTGWAAATPAIAKRAIPDNTILLSATLPLIIKFEA